jgi:hypothetical protein
MAIEEFLLLQGTNRDNLLVVTCVLSFGVAVEVVGRIG